MVDQFKLPPKRAGKKRVRIIKEISKNQLEILRRSCYEKSQGMGFLFDFIYYGALRRSEVGKLKVNSFNWEEWFLDLKRPIELSINMAKGNKDRIVLIPSEIIKKFVNTYLQTSKLNINSPEQLKIMLSQDQKPIFSQGDGENISGWVIWKKIKKISQGALNIQIRPHELRHARATDLEKKGHNIRAIQHYLGHSNPQITEKYLHTTEKHSLNEIKNKM